MSSILICKKLEQSVVVIKPGTGEISNCVFPTFGRRAMCSSLGVEPRLADRGNRNPERTGEILMGHRVEQHIGRLLKTYRHSHHQSFGLKIVCTAVDISGNVHYVAYAIAKANPIPGCRRDGKEFPQ